MYKKEVRIANKTGLHARPANEFAKRALEFNSDINVEFKGKIINAKSIVGLMTAGISSGSVIFISAEGWDEQQAVEELAKLVETDMDREWDV